MECHPSYIIRSRVNLLNQATMIPMKEIINNVASDLIIKWKYQPESSFSLLKLIFINGTSVAYSRNNKLPSICYSSSKIFNTGVCTLRFTQDLNSKIRRELFRPVLVYRFLKFSHYELELKKGESYASFQKCISRDIMR